MKYTKPWTTEHRAAEDDWHSWLAINALGGLEYQLLYWETHIELEFFDVDKGQDFALEFGL
jgi:hypothetical protein